MSCVRERDSVFPRAERHHSQKVRNQTRTIKKKIQTFLFFSSKLNGWNKIKVYRSTRACQFRRRRQFPDKKRKKKTRGEMEQSRDGRDVLFRVLYFFPLPHHPSGRQVGILLLIFPKRSISQLDLWPETVRIVDDSRTTTSPTLCDGTTPIHRDSYIEQTWDPRGAGIMHCAIQSCAAGSALSAKRTS